MRSSRRQFLAGTSAALTATPLAPLLVPRQEALRLPYPISCNQYTWFTFFRREGRDWNADLPHSVAEFAKSGITAFEPNFERADEVERLAPLLKEYHIALPSFYVNSTLHEASQAGQSIETVLGIAEAARKAGAKIVVTNPSPIQWGGAALKTDAQLVEQAKNLDRLGASLRKLGMVLSYHTHDVELRAGAREFHHMMLNTDPANLTFCMDVHWIYRGSGNSELAVFDVLKQYGKRITVLHIRQSRNGVWLEAFEPTGDVDYHRVVSELKNRNVAPHLVIEQCLEKESSNQLSAVEAHRRDLAQVKATFAPLMR